LLDKRLESHGNAAHGLHSARTEACLAVPRLPGAERIGRRVRGKDGTDDEDEPLAAPLTLKQRSLLSAEEIDRAIARLAHQILEPEEAQSGLVLIGIRRGGETLARRLAAKIGEIAGHPPSLGFLNINLYRDDDLARELPESEIHDDLTGRLVVIVDDVLYTGRTVRSALDAVTDLGRPKVIRLAVLVDRGLRELPVQADYVGRFIPTSRRERVEVRLSKSPAPTDEVTLVVDDHAAS
jgi:pyrimidine operon attenuation protein/uracil phosphoribosyltransferase